MVGYDVDVEGPGTDSGTQDELLYETLARGGRVTSGVKVTDFATGETVFVLPETDGTLVARGLKGGVRLERRWLRLGPQEDVDPFLVLQATTSESVHQEDASVEFINLRAAPSAGLARILARDRHARRQALEWEQSFGDPVEGLQNLLRQFTGDSAEDVESWNDLVEEPY